MVNYSGTGENANKSTFVSVLLLLVITFGLILGINGYYKFINEDEYITPIENMFNAYVDVSEKDFLKAFPKFCKSELEDGIVDGILEFAETCKFKDIKYTEKSKKSLDKDTLKQIEEFYYDKYDEKVKVKEGYTLKLSLKFKLKLTSPFYNSIGEQIKTEKRL